MKYLFLVMIITVSTILRLKYTLVIQHSLVIAFCLHLQSPSSAIYTYSGHLHLPSTHIVVTFICHLRMLWSPSSAIYAYCGHLHLLFTDIVIKHLYLPSTHIVVTLICHLRILWSPSFAIYAYCGHLCLLSTYIVVTIVKSTVKVRTQ